MADACLAVVHSQYLAFSTMGQGAVGVRPCVPRLCIRGVDPPPPVEGLGLLGTVGVPDQPAHCPPTPGLGRDVTNQIHEMYHLLHCHIPNKRPMTPEYKPDVTDPMGNPQPAPPQIDTPTTAPPPSPQASPPCGPTTPPHI